MVLMAEIHNQFQVTLIYNSQVMITKSYYSKKVLKLQTCKKTYLVLGCVRALRRAAPGRSAVDL